jgi:hypothetical protein
MKKFYIISTIFISIFVSLLAPAFVPKIHEALGIDNPTSTIILPTPASTWDERTPIPTLTPTLKPTPFAPYPTGLAFPTETPVSYPAPATPVPYPGPGESWRMMPAFRVWLPAINR